MEYISPTQLMVRYSYFLLRSVKYLMALAFMLLMICLLSCSKVPNQKHIEHIKSGLSILEAKIIGYDFSPANPLLDTINKDFFKILNNANNAKSTADLLNFRFELNNWLSKFPIEDVTEIDEIFFSSFFTSLSNRSFNAKLAICDMYTDFINSEMVNSSDKERLKMSVTFYRDLALYFEGEKPYDFKSDEIEEEEYDPGKRNRDYWLRRCALGDTSWDYCWDCCMRETWDDLNYTETATCFISFFWCMGVRAVSCAEDCSRTDDDQDEPQK